MRLMLGNQEPSLLIRVEKRISPTEFSFWVINGHWGGYFKDGFISINGEIVGDKCEILTDNQDRLRGEYNDVFLNFYNKQYVAPKQELFKLPEDFVDNIPF